MSTLVVTIGGYLLLCACGGGRDHSSVKPTAQERTATAQTVMSRSGVSEGQGQSLSLQIGGGRLNREELARISATGVIPKAFQGPVLSSSTGGTTPLGSRKSACSGEFRTMTHEEALAHAGGWGEWRITNAKELTSRVDHGTDFPALDSSVFPVSGSRSASSSTPQIANSSDVGYTTLGTVWTLMSPRASATTNGLRLVKSTESLFTGRELMQ